MSNSLGQRADQAIRTHLWTVNGFVDLNDTTALVVQTATKCGCVVEVESEWDPSAKKRKLKFYAVRTRIKR